MNEPTGPRKFGGSASVAGDQIAVSKESSLTGEVYVRADGKKGKFSIGWWRVGYFPFVAAVNLISPRSRSK